MNTDLILEYFLGFLTRKTLQLKSYQLTEEPNSSKIILDLSDDGEDKLVEGSGVGMIDAGFNSLVNHFSKHSSLNTVKLEDVYFQVDHRANKDVSFKSKMEIKLEFSNHCKDKSWFSERLDQWGTLGLVFLFPLSSFT